MLFLHTSSRDPIICPPSLPLGVTGWLLGEKWERWCQYAHLHPLISLGTVSCHKWIFWQRFFYRVESMTNERPCWEIHSWTWEVSASVMCASHPLHHLDLLSEDLKEDSFKIKQLLFNAYNDAKMEQLWSMCRYNCKLIFCTSLMLGKTHLAKQKVQLLIKTS